MKIPTGGIITIAAIAAIGIGAYFLLKDFKLGDLFGAPLVMAGAAPETIKETGAVGGVGDIIYNISGGAGLRESATTPEGEGYKSAVKETEGLKIQVGQPEAVIPEKAIVARAVAQEVSTGIVDEGLPLAMLKGPITIGAGLGAIQQQVKYREALPTPELKAAALEKEYSTRQEWVRGHPVESMIGFPALIAHAATTPTKQTDFFSTMARGWGRLFG